MDSVQPDLELETIKAGSRQTWIDGDYGKIAKSIESAAVEFVARRNIAPGMRVLDVACGSGNVAIPAARAGAEVIGIDIAPTAKGQASSEHAVTVAMQDSGGPYDFHLSRHLLRLGENHEIPMRRDLFRYYHSDAQSAIAAGHDIRTALLAFGCDATHGYERTHIDSLVAMSSLIARYLLSPPVFASDAQSQESLENFSHQLEHETQMENDTRVPPVESIFERREDGSD